MRQLAKKNPAFKQYVTGTKYTGSAITYRLELGYPDTQSDNWYGSGTGPCTPRPIIMKLNAAVTSAPADPEIARKFAQSRAIPTPSTPEEMGALLKDELARGGRLVREKGLKDS